MSGERQSTTRRRLAGEICCACKTQLLPDPSHHGGERWCDHCAPRRRVYVHFQLNRGWCCQFLEADLKTPLPRKVTFTNSAKIVELAQRGGALKDLAAKQALDYGLSMGRGSLWLMLTPEQYGKLKSSPTRRNRPLEDTHNGR